MENNSLYKFNKNKRVFFLDFIRVFAMFIVISYHFSVYFQSSNCTMTNFFLRKGTGTLGVTLFFMVSGASLMLNYGEKIELKKYYKKRFLGIFPMFWIAYTISFLLNFLYNKGFFYNLPIYKLGITVIGMDGYLSDYVSTWYLLGEWFLGAIILIYILFPLLRYLMDKYPKAYISILLIAYLSILINYKFKIAPTKNIIVSIFSFSLGMYFIKYIKNIKWWWALIALFVLTVLELVKLNETSHVTLVYSIIGYNLFLVLAYIGQKINFELLIKVINILNKYSYAIFLVHHRVWLRLGEYFNDVVLDKYGIICVYCIGLILIFSIAKLLYNLNKKLLNFCLKVDF